MAKQSFQRLTARLLDRELNVAPTKHQIKSGTIPAAQIVTQLQPPGSRSAISENFLSQVEHLKPAQLKLYYLIHFMLASACRINEALAVKPADILAFGQVRLKSSKKSGTRIVQSGLATSFMIECAKKNITPWEGWSRFFVHRQFKKYGLDQKINNKKVNTVTHICRHLVSKEIKNNGMDQISSIQALGHKTKKANDYYFK